MNADLLDPRVRAALEALDVEYEVMACDPALADTAAFVEAYGIPLDQSANTILVVSKGAEPTYVACVLLAPTSLDVNNVVRREMGVRKASFAAADPVRVLTGHGDRGRHAVRPAGRRCRSSSTRACSSGRWVILGGGNRSSKLKVTPDVLTRLPAVRVIEGLAVIR